MTNISPSIWTPLAEHQPMISDHGSNESLPVWYWVPGWSFQAEIFEPLYSSLPGQHFGLSFSALFQALAHPINQKHKSQLSSETSSPTDLTPPQFEEAVSLIREHAKPGAHWVGWSLGGALAWQTVANEPRLKAQSITALATGQRFLADQPDSPIGMQPEVFQTFCQQFEKSPVKTLKRFLMLCAQGSSNPRELVSTLSQVQLTAEDPKQVAELAATLSWLKDYRLDDLANVQTTPASAMYAAQDALQPGGLNTDSGVQRLQGSHGFLLEADSQAILLRYLTQLATGHATDEEISPC